MILIGVISLACVSGLCLFINHADAAISYTPSSGALASTASLNENWVEQMYQADKDGTLALRTATTTGNETSPVLHTYAFEPADYIMLGGSNNDFYVTVSGWDATLLNMTVRINGTDFFGAAQTEDIRFTGNGTLNATKTYRTSNESQVVDWCLASGSASVSVVVGQGQWGRIWKTSVNSYRFVNESLVVSGFYNLTNTTISFYPSTTTVINAGTLGRFVFGNLDGTGVARWGCYFVNEKPDVNVSMGGTGVVSYLKFYACSFMSYPDNRSNSSLRVSETSGKLDIRNCVFSQNSYVNNGGTNSIFKRNTFVSAISGLRGVLGTEGTMDDQFFDNISIPITIGTSALTAGNCSVNGYDYLFQWTPIGITPYVHKLQNFKVLGNMNALYTGTSTGEPLVKLQYGIQIRTRNQIDNLSGAIIRYYQINTSSLVSTLIAAISSGLDGVAPYTFLDRSIWQKNAVEPNSNFSAHVWVNLSGYQDVHLNFTMNKEMIFDVVLLPVPCISVLSNLTRITGTNATYWNGTCYTVWNNYTGNISGLVLNDMSSGVSGSLTYWWSALTGVNGEWWVNDTHVGIGGGTGDDFSMTDPNPANNSINQTGILLNNNLSSSPLGLDCAVDVSYQNFTDTPENLTITASSINSNTTDGMLYNLDVDYLTCRDAVSCSAVIDSFGYVTIGQLNIPLYKCFRGGLMFDTRTIPSNAIIDSLSLNFTLYYYDSDRDFSLIIQNGQPIYPHEPMLISDYDLTKYSNDGGSFNTALLPTVTNPFSIILNNTGIGWINKSGITKLMIRSSEDINSIVPSIEYIQLYLSDFFGGHEEYKPHLFITYHLPVNWSRVVNLTFKSNSSGVWTQFGFVQALWNGTWSCFNQNMTNASTQYWWSVQPEINGTVYAEQFYTFTTGTRSSSSTSAGSDRLSIGVASGGMLGIIGLVFLRRKKLRRKNV